jgi:cysteine synthase A
VVCAGTGGTSATIGRYIRYRQYDTQLCVADPENSVFYDYFNSGDCLVKSDKASNVEGIGRPRVEPSFVPQVIDRMIRVPDAATYATIHFLEKLLNRKPGGSTGTNVFAAFQIMAELNAQGHKGSVVSMLCDPGDRYLDTYYNLDWLDEKGFDLASHNKKLITFYKTGKIT